MSPEIVFASSPLMTAAIGSLGAAAAAGAAALLMVPRVAERILPRPKETRLADFLPFDSILPDGATIRFKDGTIGRLISVTGLDQTFLKQEEGVAHFLARKAMIDALADAGAVLRIFTIREPVRVEASYGYPNEIALAVAERWNSAFHKAYNTTTVLCVSLKNAAKYVDRLDEVIANIESTLQKYHPKVITQEPDEATGGELTLGSFFGRLVSPVSRPVPKGTGDHLADALAADEVEFLRDGSILFRSGAREKRCAAIGIRRLGDSTSTQLANELNAVNAEVVILQTIEPQSKGRALIMLKQQQQMMGTTSFSPEVGIQYQAAIEMVDGVDDSKASLCFFSETIFVFGDTAKEVAEQTKLVRQILTNGGVTSAVERGASQASWFMQFPSFDVKPRIYRLMSTNVAQLATFDRPPIGLQNSAWGKGPIAMLYTGSNSVYKHQFHIASDDDAVGHGLCIAPTGAGKTTLMQFFSLMASRHRNLQHYFFDRFQGTYIFTSAMGGKYLSFNAERMTNSIRGGMNPFSCQASDDNVEFLKVWLQAISGCQDADSLDQISNAVEMGFDVFGDEERSLAAMYDGSFTPNSPVRDALAKWVDPSIYGSMFNAEKDCIDLDDNWLTTFDMTNLLNDRLLAGASVSYIMHRIRQAMKRKRAPGFIFIDETEPLLRNDQFKMFFLVMLQEFRKLGGVVISVFQRPEALKASGISELVRQQCGTYYLFPNPGATAKDYEEFELTPYEMQYLLGRATPARSIKRGLLIKKPSVQESVIVDIDLGGLGPYLKVFSSSAKNVSVVNDLQRQFGEAWVRQYMDYEAA